jgi:WS/DGAT/MGAT family acyltransferase
MQQLSPMDAAFLYLENESTHAHGTFVWIYDAADCDRGAVNRRALMDHMASRLAVSPIFTRKIHRLPLDFDYPYWVEDEGFELLYHVRELSMPTGGDWADFCALVSGVHSQPLDQDHPLWEMTLVPELNDIPGLPASCFAILGKFHHVAIDGATGMDIIARIHDCPGREEKLASGAAPAARKPGLRDSLFRAAVRNVGAMDKSLDLLGARSRPTSEEKDNIPQPVEVTTPDPPEEPGGIPQTVFNRAISNESAWDSRSFDLAEIKAMRKAVDGATVNDVLLTICAGGLRNYLQSVDALPEAPMKAGCPVNIRTAEQAKAGGNMISAMIVNMHTDTGDPLERLAAITRSSAAAKHRASQRGSRKVLDIVSVVPAQAQALLGHAVGAVARKLNRAVQFNCSVSNLPGPQQDLYMLGGLLQTIGAAMPVMNGYGLFLGLTTCAGKLSVSMSSSANILSEPALLGDAMEQAYRELRQATRPRTVKRTRTRKQK